MNPILVASLIGLAGHAIAVAIRNDNNHDDEE